MDKNNTPQKLIVPARVVNSQQLAVSESSIFQSSIFPIFINLQSSILDLRNRNKKIMFGDSKKHVDKNHQTKVCRDLLNQIKAMGGGDKKTDGLRPLSQELEIRESDGIQPKRISTRDWKNKMKLLRRIRARSDAVKYEKETEDDEWITPKEARSEVKKQYLGNRSLTLAQKIRLEDLIDRGKLELAVASAIEAKKNTTQVTLRRKDSDGTWSTLHVLRQKLEMVEISKGDYETMEKRILQAQSQIDNTAMEPKLIETGETRRLRAKIMEIEKRRRAVSKELKAHLEQCARDDISRVRLGLYSATQDEGQNDDATPLRHGHVGNVSILKEYMKIYMEREALAKKLAATIYQA